MKFYDVKAKESFNTDNFKKITKITKNGRKIVIAKAKSPITGITSTRIISNTKA
jgi:hypothetical protein